MLSTHILDLPPCQDMRGLYEKWDAFMEESVDFWLKTSVIHTKRHCTRVLLFALLIGKRCGLDEKAMNALGAAAVFHDSRRRDDHRDTGQGQRAAMYYKEFCAASNLAFDERTYYAVYYHDRKNELGFAAIEKALPPEQQGKLVYSILKDADALDRFRFSHYGSLDVRKLRTKEARQLVAFAREVVTWDCSQKL